MLLSLGGELDSNPVEDPIALGLASAPASAQVSVTTPSTPLTSVSVSLVSSTTSVHDSATDAVSPRQISANNELSLSIITRPAIFLRDQDGNILSSLDGPPSSDATFIDGEAPSTNQDPNTLAEQAKELTPEGLAQLPKVPWSLDTSIYGSLSSDRGWMSFKVPVGPNTNTLRLAVRPEHDDGTSSTAMVDQMYLVGADGVLIASVTGVATLSTGSRQTLVVTLQSPPPGGILVVRMVQPSTPSPAGSTDSQESTDPTDSTNSGNGLGALTPPSFSAPNNFTVDVQRDDSLPQTPGDLSGPPPVVVIPPGSYLPSSLGTAQNHFSIGPATSSSNYNAMNIEPGYVSNTSNRLAGNDGAHAPIDSPDIDSESTSISLGPLVSRGSAPMGPALATSIDDPAPSISRDDQDGRDSALERLEGQDVELVLKLRLGGEADRTTVNRLDPQDVATADEEFSPLTALKGLGGLPLMVASFHHRQTSTPADDLAATLREHSDQAAGLASGDESLTIASIERRGKGDEIARAGIATRAVGFIVALGLASGPLYPDLVALARRKLAHKRRGGSPTVATTKRRLFHRRSIWPIS
ncbi:MAG: hypothetical protein P4L85_10965 [Paludisphaera borealis]|uniref:hypothetical protein n=1 Tax=Paludisphaera borealis TaxID=1387353 RepID=UPI002847C73F|nr:hypothetical protein [Paludisphaera borealis]MDR3619859.1 hypothetical protein [Paludisphaera borealis]